jgi:putative phosphoribosyl transferase
MAFRDRSDAGKQLSEKLGDHADEDVVVLGLPRGGVPVAFEVAKTLGAPLDVIVVRKLGLPSQPELAMGAISEDGVRVIDEEVLGAGREVDEFTVVEQRERVELERQVDRFRAGRGRVPPRE